MNPIDKNLFGEVSDDQIENLYFLKNHIEYINYFFVFEKKDIKRLRIINERIIYERRKEQENQLGYKIEKEPGFPFYALAILYKDFITEYKLAIDQLNCFDFYVARNNYLEAISINAKYQKKSLDEFFTFDNFVNENKFQNQFSSQKLGSYFCEEFLRIGDEYYMKKIYPDAMDYFSRFLNINPKDGGVLYKTGICMYNTCKYKQALEYFLESLKYLKISYTNLYYWIGHTHFELANYSECIEFLTKSLKDNPFDNYSYYVRGMSKMSLQDYTGAISDFNFVLKSEPSNGECYYLRGECNLKLKKKENALVDLSRAGELGVKRSYELISKLQNK